MQAYPVSCPPFHPNAQTIVSPREINAVQAASRIVAAPIQNNTIFIEDYKKKEYEYIQIIKELYEENKKLKQNHLKSPVKVVYSEKGDIPFKNITAFHQAKHPTPPLFKKDRQSQPKKENIVIVDKNNNSFYLALDPQYKEELRKVTEGDQGDTPISINAEEAFKDDQIEQSPIRYPMNEVKEAQSVYSVEEAQSVQKKKGPPSIAQKMKMNMKKCNPRSESQQESQQQFQACSIGGYQQEKTPIVINNIHYIATLPQRDSLASQNSSSAEIVDIKRKVYSRESHLLGNNYTLLCAQKGDENNLGNINKFGRKLKRFGHSIYM